MRPRDGGREKLTSWVGEYLPHVVEWPTAEEEVQRHRQPARTDEEKPEVNAFPVAFQALLFEQR